MLPGSVSRLAGGLFTSVRRLSEAMNDLGLAKVQVIGNTDEHTSTDLKKWRDAPRLLSATGLRRAADELARILKGSKFDLVHTQFIWSYASLATVRWQQANRSRRYLISPRGMLDPWAVRHSRWKKRIAGLLFESKHLKRAACFHALCESEAQAIRNFGLSNPICVVPNGIDVPETEKIRKWAQADCNAFEASRRKTMLFVGRIHPKKGLAELIQAWADALQKMNDWQLVIAGWDDGNHVTKLKELTKSLSLNDAIHFPGPLYGQEKSIALANANAFVLPSYSEGLPMAVLEAWAHQLPVLMTKQCNLTIGFERECAFQVDLDNQKLSGQLVDFTKCPDAAHQRMGANGRALTLERFQWSAIAQQMSEMYNWVLDRQHAPQFVYDGQP